MDLQLTCRIPNGAMVKVKVALPLQPEEPASGALVAQQRHYTTYIRVPMVEKFLTVSSARCGPRNMKLVCLNPIPGGVWNIRYQAGGGHYGPD